MDKKKIQRGIKLIQAAGKKAAEAGQPLEVCYSGGKDSDAILELVRMSGVEYRAIYKNTTIDPPGTIKHVKERGVEMIRPKQTFKQLMEQKGMPNRFRRFCCSVLKEYKVLDYAVVGVRRDESTKRSKLYKEPELCRQYTKSQKVRQYFPILDWTTEDVAQFLSERGVKCAPVYYDENGIFHPERRLGCMACPLAYKTKRIEAFKRYPGLVKMYINSAQIFMQSHEKIRKRYNDPYVWFVRDLFCDSMEEFNQRFGATLFNAPVDCKKFLEEYFMIRL